MDKHSKPTLIKKDIESIKEPAQLDLDQIARSIPVGEIPFKEVAIKDLPLYVVISNLVFAVDLPVKEFLSTEEFEEYLERYADQKFKQPKEREKFIRKQTNNALILEDEIKGEYAWQFNREVRFKNARLCGFGILKTQSKQFYMFQTGMGIDLPSQFAAYQALTYKMINPNLLEVFSTGGSRSHFKRMIGTEVYDMVLEALGVTEGTPETPETS